MTDRPNGAVWRSRLRPWRRATLFVGVAFALVASGSDGQPQDEKIVQMDTLNVRDVLYHLSGGGGNALALIDEVSVDGGVVLIDTKPAGWGTVTTEVIGQVTDLPVRTIINSHAHPEHAGSNAEFESVGEIIAHENTKARMVSSGLYADGAAGLPTMTFAERHSLLADLDRIDLYYFGRAHTDGDIVVVFPEKGVAYLGDLFPRKGVPVVDTDNGGSGIAFPETLARAVAEIDGDGIRRVITGHGAFPTTYAGRGRRERGTNRAWSGFYTWDDLVEYADFTRDFLAAVEEAFRAGQSAAAAVASLQLPERYADYDMERASAGVAAIYAELAAR